MDVRDAVEDDAGRVADLTGLPRSAAGELLHDRTVRVAAREGEIVGVVAFDARPGVVHVTRLTGDRDAIERLLEEPIGFAAVEDMAVEVVVPPGDRAADAVREAGFEAVGAGPRFEGEQTRRFRLEP